ncbi:MAG: F0F1 ATP synthase subunit B family protein [Acidobacteriaceae bacterium]
MTKKISMLVRAAMILATLAVASPMLQAEPQAAPSQAVTVQETGNSAGADAHSGSSTSAGQGPRHRSVVAEEESGGEMNTYRHSPMVARIGQAFGISTENTARLFEIINFIILAGVILWLVFKSVPALFRNRTMTIQKQLVDARTATEDANQRLTSVEQRLAKLDDEIAAIRAHAEQTNAHDEARIKASVEEEKQKIIAAAEQEIATASAAAQRDIRKYAAELAIDQAARRIAINAETDRLLVQSFAGRLVGDDGKGGQN